MRTYINALKNRPQLRRDRLFRELIFVIVLAYFAALAIAAIQMFNVRERNSREQITRISENVRYSYEQLIQNTERFLHICRRWGAAGDLDWNSPAGLDERLIPFLDEIPHIGSMMLSDWDGVHYVLYKDREQWLSCTPFSASDEPACTQAGWAFEVGPAIRYYPWFRNIISAVDSAEVYWATPDSLLFSPNIGITGSTRWFNPAADQITVASFGLKFENLCGLLENGLESPNTRLMVFNGSGQVFPIQDSLLVAGNTDKALQKAIGTQFLRLRDTGDFSEPFPFRFGMERWWGRFVALPLNHQSVRLAIVTPEKDFYQHFQERQRSLILVLGLVFLLGPVLLVILIRVYTRQIIQLERNLSRDTADVATLLHMGEGINIEFKSTLRYNLKIGKPGKEIEHAVMKTVAAFLNSSGGTLLVGVDDTGKPLGLAGDRFPNNDKFMLHFKNMIVNYLGADFSEFIRFDIREVSGQDVFVIQCAPASRPAFIKYNDDDEFYIRIGPSSRKLRLSKALEYIDSHFEED